jgi:hypothetical protein
VSNLGVLYMGDKEKLAGVILMLLLVWVRPALAFEDSDLSGTATNIAGADTNPDHFGSYPLGGGFIGGPLLNDLEAAKVTAATQKSIVETGVNGPANEADNSYYLNIYYTDLPDYQWQLSQFWNAYAGTSWYDVAQRIDGACPMVNPTTADVLQWAANKWGIHPLILYAEASQEGDWDNTSLGDWSDGIGTSSGVLQVADRNTAHSPYHAFPGFDGGGANLARENTCFNADFYAAHLYAAFNGLTGECPAGDIGAAIGTWLVGHTSSGGSYFVEVYSLMVEQVWISRTFAGAYVPM